MAKEKQKMENNVKEEKKQKTAKNENVMRKPVLEKVVLNCGGTAEKLEKSVKLLEILTGKKVKEVVSSKRIPSLGVRPGLKTGCTVTLRGKEKEALLRRLLGANDYTIKKKQVADNHFSFGIKEYLEIPDMEYQRNIGIVGLDVTAVFKRAGKRVAFKKIKHGKVPRRQDVTKEEIIDYLKNKLKITVEDPQSKAEEE
jgi:large subunit ribosomal protein L5